MAETKKRRKPRAQRKEDSIRIRVTDAQKKLLMDAATRAGVGLSAWALMLLLREAQRTGEGGAR